MYKETHARSIVKTISWRFWATLTTVSLVFFFIGEVGIALSIGLLEVIIKMIIYFLHERAWTKIKFGRKEIKPVVVWITGLVRSGKSDIAENVVEKLKKQGYKAEHLDGHTIRNLIHEEGFTRHEVNSHIKRVGYLAKKLEEQGVFVVASFLSPYRESRDFVKSICGSFIEVYVSTPAEVCEKRDTTGIYKKARSGEITNLAGVNAPYEIPLNGAININTENVSVEEAGEIIYQQIKKNL